MSKVVIIAIACICTASTFAGAVTVDPIPDAGATVSMLGIGAIVLGLFRKISR
jgi:hypothetical protein